MKRIDSKLTVPQRRDVRRLPAFAAIVGSILACGRSERPTPLPSHDPIATNRDADPDLPTPTVEVVATPASGIAPDAEVDADGVVHLAYVRDENAEHVRWSRGVFTDPVRINSRDDTVSGGAFRGPDLALGANGRVLVIWYSNAFATGRPELSGVHFSHRDARSNAFVHSRNLNETPSDNYSLAADDRGNVAVVWTDGQLFVSRSTDNGESFADAEPVAAPVDPCECCATRAAFDAGGALHCLYRDKAANVRDVHLLSARPGGGFDRVKLGDTSWTIEACPMSGSFLSLGPAGLTAAWRMKNEIFHGRIVAQSTVAVVVPTSGVPRYPVALTGGDGVTVVGWKQATALHWRAFDASGTPLGSERSMATANPDRPTGVVLPDGRYVLFG